VTYLVETSPAFRRHAAKFFRQHPDLQSRFASLVVALEDNPFEPSLRLHALSGQFDGFHAVRLTYAFRVVLILRVEEQRITLVDIGTHDEVYRR
jgi:mRNA-degrading endonuclease YafQ of YafQ-DinJ toxin-antitoxin module